MSFRPLRYTDQEIYEAAARLGSQTAAARALGIGISWASKRTRAHAAAHGLPVPRDVPDRSPHAPLGRRRTAIEDRLDRFAAIEDRLDTLIGMVETLLARPEPASKVIEFHPEHRRMADGGRRVREQRREARRAIA